jgi:hypothetical protein
MADQNALMMINPFEALETGRKRAYAGYEAGQAAAQREALNELYAQALDPRTGTIDRNKLYSGLAGRRMGAMIPGLEMEEAKLAEQRGKSMQEQTKGLEGRMQYWKRMIPADPRLAPAWVSAAYADPVVGPELSKFGSPEEAIAGIPQDPAQYMQWVEGASMFADEVAKRRVPTGEAMLTAETARRGQDVTMRGQDITAETTRRGQDITAETTRRGQDISAEVSRRGQDINAYIAGPEHQASVTAARKRAESDVKFVDEFNSAKTTAQRTLSLIDQMLGDATVQNNKVVVPQLGGKPGKRPMAGFEQAVGASIIPGARFVPGTSARNFNAYHDQAVGTAFMQAFETLKGGGQITEKEGEKATAALNRMNLAVDEKEYIRAAREFQTEVKSLLNLAENRYNRIRPGGTNITGETPSIDALLDKYK